MTLTEKRKSQLCLQCMACCQQLNLPILRAPHKDVIAFYETRGLNVQVLDNIIYILLDHTCAQLTGFGCKIYAQRPRACKDYDGRKDPFMKDRCLWGKEK